MSPAGAGEAARPRGWRPADCFDLGVIGITHGLSDGFANLLVPVLALMVADLGLSPLEAGVLLSAFSLGTFLFQYPLSMAADYTGRKKGILLAGMGLSAAAFLVMGWARGYRILVGLAFIAGAGNAVFHPCGTALTAERFAARRALAISYHSLGGNVGTGLMPLAQAAIASAAGWRAAVVACALPAAVLLPLVGVRFPERPAARREGARLLGGMRELLGRVLRNRNVVLLALTYTLRGLGTKGMMGFFPLLAAARLGMGTEAIGLAVSLHFGMGVLSKPIMGLLYDRWGARSGLLLPLLLTGAAALAMPFAGWATALVALAALAGVVSHVSPIILTAAADMSEREALASSVGFIYTCHGLSFLSPLIGGWLAERLGLDASYVFFALAIWAGTGVSTLLPGGRPAPR